MADLTPRQARRIAWGSGYLEHLFGNRPHQVQVFRDIRTAWASGAILYSLVIHRQYGKSRMLFIMGLEECIRKPATRCLYLTDTKVHAQDISLPLLREILEDCPEDLRPVYNRARMAYEWPNGSTLTLMGMDFDGIDKGRGVAGRVLLIDEAGFSDSVKDALAAFLPILSTRAGICLMASTPPRVPGHPFTAIFSDLYAAGNARLVPLSQNPDAPAAVRAAAEAYRRLMGESDYLREWECNFDAAGWDDGQVVPEFARVKGTVVQVVPKSEIPVKSDLYVGFDIGGRDHDALVFGFWDYVNQRLVVYEEIFCRGLNTPELARMIHAAEARCWEGIPEEERGRTLRFADWNNAHLIRDFQAIHGLRFAPTLKPEKIAQINALRVMLQEGTLILNPRVAATIRSLERARWDKTHKGYERAKDKEESDKAIGHADAVDALVYIIVNLRKHQVPPEGREKIKERSVGPRVSDYYQHDPDYIRDHKRRPGSASVQKFAAAMKKALWGDREPGPL